MSVWMARRCQIFGLTRRKIQAHPKAKHSNDFSHLATLLNVYLKTGFCVYNKKWCRSYSKHAKDRDLLPSWLLKRKREVVGRSVGRTMHAVFIWTGTHWARCCTCNLLFTRLAPKLTFALWRTSTHQHQFKYICKYVNYMVLLNKLTRIFCQGHLL